MRNTGHKILALPNTDGKNSAAQIEGLGVPQSIIDNAKPEYPDGAKDGVNISGSELSRVLYTRKREPFAISMLSCKEIRHVPVLLMAREWVYGTGLRLKMTYHFVDFAMLSDVFLYRWHKVWCASLDEALVINAEDNKYRFTGLI